MTKRCKREDKIRNEKVEQLHRNGYSGGLLGRSDPAPPSGARPSAATLGRRAAPGFNLEATDESSFVADGGGAMMMQITTDRDGNQLDGSAHYRIVGRLDMPEAWWSITLYNREHALIANNEKRYAFTSFNVIPEDDGSFVIDVAPERPAGAMNWLPCNRDEPFSVVTRFYRSGSHVVVDEDVANPPQILRVKPRPHHSATAL